MPCFLGKFNNITKDSLKFSIVFLYSPQDCSLRLWLPDYTRPFVTWNPVLHGVELFRYSLNNEYPIPDISLSYLFWCSIVLFGFSLILYRTNEALLLDANDD